MENTLLWRVGYIYQVKEPCRKYRFPKRDSQLFYLLDTTYPLSRMFPITKSLPTSFDTTVPSSLLLILKRQTWLHSYQASKTWRPLGNFHWFASTNIFRKYEVFMDNKTCRKMVIFSKNRNKMFQSPGILNCYIKTQLCWIREDQRPYVNWEQIFAKN